MPSAVTQSKQVTPSPQSDRMVNILAWIELHVAQLVIAFTALVLVLGGVYLWRYFKNEREVSANAALLEIRAQPNAADSTAGPTAADYIKVAEQHPSTRAAVRARLLAAGAFFAAGRYSEARTEFESVLGLEGTGPLAAQASYGVAASLEAQDNIDQALSRYQQVITQFPDESVADQARLAVARLQASRQPEVALRLYDEVLRGRGDGPFAQQATQQRETLLRAHPELTGTNASVPTATVK